LRKLYLAVSISYLLIVSYLLTDSTKYAVQAEIVIPSYAKWGKLAMEETKLKYPDAQIIDYLHIGRQKKGDAMIEKFKLWLRRENREFGVFVSIEFNAKTEEVLHITFLETDK
jgi:hypothetical protein